MPATMSLLPARAASMRHVSLVSLKRKCSPRIGFLAWTCARNASSFIEGITPPSYCSSRSFKGPSSSPPARNVAVVTIARASKSSFAVSRCLPFTALSRGVCPLLLPLSTRICLLSISLLINTGSPCLAASCNTLSPYRSIFDISAFASINMSAVSLLFFQMARESALSPFFVVWFTSALASRSFMTISEWPRIDDAIRGVAPWSFASLTGAFAFSSVCTISR
mmetsp:Transcript_9895/g.19001  ORF Transcript_9895/g.19001 Transcript_9895/m.19001 type:complete len:223 (-) Transcript_9895:165-833(-)